MEPDQQLLTEKIDQEKLPDTEEKSEEAVAKEDDKQSEPILPEASSTSPDKETSKAELSSSDSSPLEVTEKLSENQQNSNQLDEKLSNESECTAAESENRKKPEDSSCNENANSSEEGAGANPNLPSFPGTVTKSVPGSNDVQIEINSNSLLDRVILYSLKNTVVDNSRLDAAKNKYMLNRGNITSNFSSNSNGSDSNSSSKSVEKLIEEFKGGCSKSISENSPNESSKAELKSDISAESSNGAETNFNTSNKSQIESGSSREGSMSKSPPKLGHEAVDESSEEKIGSSKNLTEAFPLKPILENGALDFRDKTSPNARVNDFSNKSPPAMLDLSIPHRDEKTVPPIKRNHALYVGLPDFSKQIFTAPSISRAASSSTSQPSSSLMGAPKIRHPDFSNVHRTVAPDLQMRHPDFSKSFSKPEASSVTPPAITPSNFPEIVRKNNYISDLQLKPPSSSIAESQSSPTPTSSSSYKIDFRSSTTISQKLVQDSKPEQPSTSQTVYPNMKKEGINAYHQQLIIDEPMAHIIHKNQFLPNTNEQSRVGGWSDRNERLLGGASATEAPKHAMEAEHKSQVPYPSHQFHNSSEDLRKTHPAYYPPHAREFNNNSQESQQLSHEFSLKQKEHQLRQEGTIITIKNEPAKTPTKEIVERRSADLFRDYKLKQPKESPDSARRSSDTSTLASYQQAYPDFPPSFPKYNHEDAMKPSQAPPLVYSHERQPVPASSSRSYHSPSPVAYHHQAKSPLTVPPGPSLMNPPQNWPPPLVPQPMPRHMQNSSNAHPSMSSPSPTNYQHASSSQSPHINYGYPYPLPAQTGPTAVKVSQSYQPYKNAEPYRNLDVKEIPNRHYQPPTSSNAASNYYHQKYPDFSRHFDPGKQLPPNEHNAKYLMDHRQAAEINYQRYPPHHELEIRSVREQQAQYRTDAGPSYYAREAPRIKEYPPRLPEPVRHQEPPRRIHDEPLDRARVIQPLKVERRMEEPPNIQAGPSNLPLRRPEPTDVSVIAKVKIEPSPVPLRSAPVVTSIIKSSKSIFAEVKRESPLDLSVKTVKTKADSTGCDQDISRQRPEPSGLKVEFTPNFAKVAKTDCRQQARTGPQDYPTARATSSVSERSSENNRTPPAVCPPQMPHVSSNRNYFHEQRFQATKEIERPHAPVPALSQSSHLSERPSYEPKPQIVVDMQRQPPMNVNAPYAMKDMPRTNEQHHVDARRQNQYYLPPHQAPAPVPYPTTSNKNIHHSSSTIDAARPSNHAPNPRDPLYYERERDRKYVEEILYRRNRKETLPPHADMRQFQPIVSPPRKRPIDHQNINNSVPPKMGKVEEPMRIPEQRVSPAMPQHSMPMTPANRYQFYEQQRFQKVENHVKNLSAIGQPPALLKNDVYEKPSYDMKYHSDNRSEATPKQTAAPIAAQYPSSQYYPNPKAEMIQRSDPTSSYKMEKTFFPNQNFQQRPDDIALQHYPRIQHPIQQESGIKNEQLAGPLPGTSGESARSINGLIPSSVSGSNGNIARGADQSTILKLKTNLELKEQKKLIISKSEPNDDHEQARKKDLSPRLFRTKGELKGFIPLPTSADVKTVSPAPPAAPSAFDMLDWGSACNDFVQQLETGKKRSSTKKRAANPSIADKKTEDKPANDIPGTTTLSLSSEVPKEIVKSINKSVENSSSDEDKPLLELVANTQNNGDDLKKSHTSVVEKISEKISRNMREKQRLQLEQKHAARLGEPSSSENETETRRPARTAIRVRRLRKRAALGIKKTDEEPSVEEEEEEEETEEELAEKRRHKKSTSKLDDLTSSEDERKKKKLDDKKSDPKQTKSSKRTSATKQDSTKKQENSSESSESDETKVAKPLTTKSIKKPKDVDLSIKILLEEETMTRSKRKLEIEKKQLNSKVLRNEKIVQNVAPDKKAKTETTPPSSKQRVTPKRKDSTKTDDLKRKNESDSDAATNKSKKRLRSDSKIESSSSSEESHAEELNKADRLRPRKSKPEPESPLKASKESTTKKKSEDKTPTKALTENPPETDVKSTTQCRIPFTGMFGLKDEKTSKFTRGWENETYNFKRSLKIPAGLITIGRPPQHGISHSLPDLDPQTSDTSEIFSEFVKSKDKDLKGSKGVDLKGKEESFKGEKSNTQNTNKKASSIIDLLHQRVVQSRRKFRAKKTVNTPDVVTPAVNDEDLLATPEKESEKIFGIKKNIFETSIITSRTRTENNALRKKEILKEVFGADDSRPKSAPPTGALLTEGECEAAEKTSPETAEKNISYDQKYREYLEKMNVDFLNKTNDTSKEDCKTADTSVKDEDDDEDDNETVVAENDLTMRSSKGKAKKGRGRRCKGSSGFDYIRKKKKPQPNASENPLSVNNIIKKRLAAMENLENKDESDIRKEIKGWVLNKGVGESVLHKASRLDYVDVIAYCLDRLNMNPDPKDNAGYTPLHEACSRGHLEIARILLQYGANHSETALSGIRPLHEAIENGHVEIVRLLVSFGADPCLATYSGQLPIAMAEDKEMENFLSEYLTDIDNKKGPTKSWFFEGSFKLEDPTEEGYEVFNEVPINKTDLGSSIASVFSTSLTSLVTATTQMSDNETVASESTTATPIKVPVTPMKAPSQDLIKYQHKMKKCDTNSNNLVMSEVSSQENIKTSCKKTTKNCSVVLNQIDCMKKIKKLPAVTKQEQITTPKISEQIQKLEEFKHKEDYDDMMVEDAESDSEFLELEESEAPLPPLYLLKDEGSDKWILLTDLCNLLKVKSKDAVLKQICPSSPPSLNKELIRELKMSDFLEKAICLQLFCAGEKLNVRASKVSLVRYNNSVQKLLGVQTIRMNM